MCLLLCVSDVDVDDRDVSCCIQCHLVVFFFFQAEDGIRDLVRSRGLGDVYKRQGVGLQGIDGDARPNGDLTRQEVNRFKRGESARGPVSYTHLTLPTSDLV